MATADTSLPQSAAPAVKVPMITLLICCMVTGLFAVAGVVGSMLYLGKHGKLSGSAAVAATATAKKAGSVVLATHSVVLEPMLVNLADDGGHAYLRVGIVLGEAVDPNAKPAKEDAKPEAGANAAVRDTIFDVLGRENSTVLLAPNGKEKLKSDLMAAMAQRNAALRVKEIYFTDFLVQR